jgi:hypothetical protein
VQHQDLHPGEKRGIDLEGGVLGGRADENDPPAFHMGEKGVLLGLVEPVNLVHEKDRPAPALRPLQGRLVQHLPDLLYPGEHR